VRRSAGCEQVGHVAVAVEAVDGIGQQCGDRPHLDQLLGPNRLAHEVPVSRSCCRTDCTVPVAGQQQRGLAGALDEVVCVLDTTRRVPVGVELAPPDGAADVRFAPVATKELP
jgi:hypothetical protein